MNTLKEELEESITRIEATIALEMPEKSYWQAMVEISKLEILLKKTEKYENNIR